jgi:hypothetical protein
MFLNTTKGSVRSICRLGNILLLLGLISCSTSGPVSMEKFDPLTGVTVTLVKTPLVLYRDNAATAAYARNYVNLAPIQVNRIGAHRYYLWVSVWNTMQIADISERRDGFESIVIFADGEPLVLDVTGWTPESIGVSEPVYIKPVASAVDAYYEVTADQIRLIAQASDIRLQSGGSQAKEFNLWDAQKLARSSLSEFMLAALL